MKNVKKLIPVEYMENMLIRIEESQIRFMKWWKEELQQAADNVVEIPSDQVELANKLEQADIAKQVLEQLQEYYPRFCRGADAGKWIAHGLGQTKQPLYGPATALELSTEECTRLENLTTAQKNIIVQTELEIKDLKQKLTYEQKIAFDAINELMETKKELDIATQALLEIKSLNEEVPK